MITTVLFWSISHGWSKSPTHRSLRWNSLMLEERVQQGAPPNFFNLQCFGVVIPVSLSLLCGDPCSITFTVLTLPFISHFSGGVPSETIHLRNRIYPWLSPVMSVPSPAFLGATPVNERQAGSISGGETTQRHSPASLVIQFATFQQRQTEDDTRS